MIKNHILDCGRVPLFESNSLDVAQQAQGALASNSGERQAGQRGGLTLDCIIPFQEQSNWCWAATALGILRYYEPANRTSQCQAVNGILKTFGACQDPGNPRVNKAWYVDTSLAHFGNLAGDGTYGALSFERLTAQIQNRRPVVVRVGWYGGGGHFMAVNGFSGGSSDLVSITDPSYGKTLMSYYGFCKSYQGSGRVSHAFKTKSHLY